MCRLSRKRGGTLPKHRPRVWKVWRSKWKTSMFNWFLSKLLCTALQHSALPGLKMTSSILDQLNGDFSKEFMWAKNALHLETAVLLLWGLRLASIPPWLSADSQKSICQVLRFPHLTLMLIFVDRSSNFSFSKSIFSLLPWCPPQLHPPNRLLPHSRLFSEWECGLGFFSWIRCFGAENDCWIEGRCFIVFRGLNPGVSKK